VSTENSKDKVILVMDSKINSLFASSLTVVADRITRSGNP
jgi:hypothetical protein